MPGYDADGKLWTVQYIKEDGTKRFFERIAKTRLLSCCWRGKRLGRLAKASSFTVSPVIAIAEVADGFDINLTVNRGRGILRWTADC